jgi:hypothetical protein
LLVPLADDGVCCTLSRAASWAGAGGGAACGTVTQTRLGVIEPVTASSTRQILFGLAAGAGAPAWAGAGKVAAASGDASNAEATKNSMNTPRFSETAVPHG